MTDQTTNQPGNDSSAGASATSVATVCYAELIYRDRRNLVCEWLKDHPTFVMRSLSYREREILKMRYGLRDGHFYTREEVGYIFKVTRDRIRWIERKALAKIDHGRLSA